MNSPGLKVLVITDERRILRQVSKFLAALGYEVQPVAAADQVGVLLETNPPDFLLLDAELDAFDALEFCRSARMAEGPSPCYTLLMVGDARAEDLEEALEAGVDDFLPKPIRYVELLARLRAGARSLEFERRWRRQAAVDPLTGLMNRWAFLETVRRSAPKEGESRCRDACIIMDLDFLEAINLKYGRAIGNAVVRAAADRLREQASDGQVLAGFGGGRFCIWLSILTDDEAAQQAERFRTALAETDISLDAARLRVTASFGIATSDAQRGDVEKLVEQACSALQDAKNSGRDCVTRFGQHHDDTKTWVESVADGKLLEQAVARDLMTPCTVLLHAEHAVARAAAVVRATGLKFLPVVDGEGKLAGMIAAEAVLAKPKASAAGSLRVGDVMTREMAVVDEDAGLPILMNLLFKESWPVVVVTSSDMPVGCVAVESLASLGARITVDSFAPALPYASSNDYLVVPDLCPIQEES
jgi:diguanylate cyclase (GGDEF)-like protein